MHPVKRQSIRLLTAIVYVIGMASVTPLAGAIGLQEGAQAPDFALMGSDGKLHRLRDHRGKFVVLAWFPKAFTGG